MSRQKLGFLDEESRDENAVSDIEKSLNGGDAVPVYTYNTQEVDSVNDLRVMIKGRDKSYSKGLKAINCKLPEQLIERLSDTVMGSRNTAMIALIEHALDQLEQDGKMLNVSVKEAK
ncbi:hypothetical protein BCU68_16460 [Vibrio sp. 10N.286.49.B3]|uniref:hypothetical protein n=1 Tax=unclassified Vibrio TaxID=2614977 RepID=UPI000C81B810|nr:MULTISPECIES: hypothetical protein [unclassified Vibrio]PMH40140.1 hypothetical protein BCU68_16460 [Vibrio sp. 10N.286.49.B3]PMO19999.1 hypothetical protein BCT17_21510 [Vibrio sp. 10N.222.54.F10]